jgi:hypothetical protein
VGGAAKSSAEQDTIKPAVMIFNISIVLVGIDFEQLKTELPSR